MDSHVPEDLKLTQLQIIHRHGPRTPLNYRLPQYYQFTWPLCSSSTKLHFHEGVQVIASGDESLLDITKPQKVESALKKGGECVLGQLTDTGKKVMEELGASLRKHYVEELQFKCCKSNEIYLRSTNYSRTIESLQSLLRGLFPGRESSDAEPLIIHTRDEYLEDMYGSTKCQRYNEILKEFEERFTRETASEVQELKDRLPHIFKTPDLFGRLPSPYGVYDTLAARRAHGLSLPPAVTEKTMTQLERLSYHEWFRLFAESPIAIKFAVGRFIRELHENLFHPQRRLAIYSAHDSTIGPLIAAVTREEGIPSIQGEKARQDLLGFPPFAANIVIESYEQDDGSSQANRFVRVAYNGQLISLPQCRAIGQHYPGHPSLCSLEAFSNILQKYIPRDYLEECRVKHETRPTR